MMKLLIALLVACEWATAFEFASLVVSVANPTINANTQYTISYDRAIDDNFTPTNYASSAITASDQVTVTFPASYSLTAITCRVSVNSGAEITPTSCGLSGNKVIATGVVSSSTFIASLVLIVGNVVNPSPAIETAIFIGTIGADTSGPGSFSSTIQLQADQFTSCVVTFVPTTVNSTGAMQFTIVPKNPIGSTGSIVMKFPDIRRWTNDLSSSNFFPISTSMACTSNSANVQSSIRCEGDTNEVTVTASSLFASSNSLQFSFSINTFISPPTNQPVDRLTITSTVSGNGIDVCYPYVTGLTAKTISSIVLTNSAGTSMIVNSPYNIKFTFPLPDTMSQTDTVTITFPAGTELTFSTGTVVSNFGVVPASTVYDSATLTLTFIMAQQSRTFSQGTSLSLQFGSYKAPPSTLITSAFTVTIWNNGYKKMQGTVTLTASASSVSGSVTPVSTLVNAQTSYTFSVVLIDPLTSTGKIKLTLPSTVTIITSSTSCATMAGTNINVAPTCSFNSTQNSITLTSINSGTANIGAQTLTITIQGLKNPPSTEPTSTFVVRTYYQATDDTLVAQGTLAGITATTAIIDSANVIVTPTSTQVNQDQVDYRVQLTVVHPIPVGGYFTILVPPQISVDTTAAPSHCSININMTSFAATSCTASISGSSTLITFTNPFTVVATAGTVFVAQITQVFTNPISTRPTSSFAVSTFSATGYSIASVSTAVTVAMDTADSFVTFSVSRSSSTNYGLATYTFAFSQRSPLEASSKVILQFPTDVTPSATPTCTLTLPAAQAGAITCSQVGVTLTATLPASAVAAGVSVAFTVSNVRNPPSFQPSGTYTLQTKTANNLYRYSYGLISPALANSIPTSFQNIGYLFTPTILGQATVLKVTFDPSESTIIPSSVRLTFADSFIVNTPSCNSFVDITGGSCSIAATNTISVTGTFTNSEMSFSVTGVTVPTAAPTDYSSLVSFDSGGYKIDESSNRILFTLGCTLPCRTCTTGLPASCLSCYSTSISSFIYLDNVLNTCNENCVDGKYQNINTLRCTVCDGNCATCEGSPTFCLTCKQNTTFLYLHIQNSTTQKCVAQCPDGMYPEASLDPTTCVSCNSPCETCSGGTATQCLSCLDGFFLYQTTCSTGCPIGIAIQNSNTNQCDPCDSNCATCINTTTYCTSCSGLLLLYLGQCLTNCPTPLVPQNGTCGPCDDSCLQCAGDKYTCTSCDPASSLPYLHSQRCLAECPELYYQDIGAGICSLCSLVPNLHCANCSTAAACLSCDTSYILYQQTCINYVPVGYVNISGVAVACAGDCATCSISTTNCTSCQNNNLLNNLCLVNCPSGYIGISRVCQACQSPCLTCETQVDRCLSCVTTLVPDVYLINNECLQNCPDGTFANTATNVCSACEAPCEYCTSRTQCTTCLTGFFLQGSSCVGTCQAGYTGVSRVCQQCVGNCLTCQNDTTLCTSCVNSTYLMEVDNSCVSECGQGLFIKAAEKKCVYCDDPCKTCVNTSDTCQSCLTGVLFENSCNETCPDKYYNLTNKCFACPTNCSSCTGPNTCTACINTFVLYLGFCVTSCPATHAVILNSVCTACSDLHCHQCNSADVCTACQSDYSLLNGNCLGTCPGGFETNGTHCIDTNEEILTSSSAFPVPFTIAAVVVIIACLMSKLQFQHTFMPGAVFALLGILEWGALVYFLYLYFVRLFGAHPLPLFIGLAALAYLYLLNILAVVLQNVVLCADRPFRQWYTYGPNKCCTVFSNILSTVICHKFRNILFCKLFTFAVFTAQLDSVSKFKILNIFSFLSLLHSGGAIFAAAVALPNAEKDTQLYYQCIDVIVVTSINAIMGFFTVMKSKDFFYERTPDGFDLKKKIKAEDDYFEDKIQPAGKEGEEEEGYFSNITHVKAGGLTTQPFKFRQVEESSDGQDYSYGSLVDKQYEEVSVQALELINEDQKSQHKNFDITGIDHLPQENSNYTIFFKHSEKGVGNTIQVNSEKGVQNTIGQISEKGIQNTIDHGPDVTHKSIQPSQAKLVDQSAQRYSTIDAVDRSAQRTVFYQDDQSMQYDESMVSKKPSMKHQSIQNAVSVSSKNIMYKPEVHSQSNQKSSIDRNDQGVQNSTISRHDEAVQKSTIEKKSEGVQNYQMLEDKSLMAVRDTSSKGNQKSVSVGSNAVQVTQKSYRDESIQRAPSQKNQQSQFENQAQFDQFNQEISPSHHENVIFEEEDNEEEEIRQSPRLKEHEKDELILPKHQIKSYQEELEERIRQKESQLQNIKKKIETKQKANSEKKEQLKKSDLKIQPGKLYNKGQKNSSQGENTISLEEESHLGAVHTGALRKQNKQIGEEPDQVDKTIEEIDVIDDEGENQKIKVQFEDNEDVSKKSQDDDDLAGILENHQDQILCEDSDEKEDNNPSFEMGSFEKPQEVRQIGRRNLRAEEAEVSDVKEGSTKLYSSIRPHNKPNRRDINGKQGNSNRDFDPSEQDMSHEIDEHPIRPIRPGNYRSDMSDTIEEMHPNLNRTTDLAQPTDAKIRERLREKLPQGIKPQRKAIPTDQPEGFIHHHFDRSQKQIPQQNKQKVSPSHSRRSSLLLAGKSQFVEEGLARKKMSKGSLLKIAKKWEYQNEDKNISESGEEEVPNTRIRNPHHMMPFETDKEETEFRNTAEQFRVSKVTAQPRSHHIIPSPEKKMPRETNPLILEMESHHIPVKPRMQDFGSEFSGEASGEPYIEDDGDSDYASRYKNNMILGQMLQRPNNDDLSNYYREAGNRSKSKPKKRQASRSRGKIEAERIYGQRLGK